MCNIILRITNVHHGQFEILEGVIQATDGTHTHTRTHTHTHTRRC